MEPSAAGTHSASAATTNTTRTARQYHPPRRLLNQRLPQRPRHGMRARVGVELPHRVADVCASGLSRDVELTTDLLVAHAVGQQAKNFALPLCQHRQLLRSLPACERSEEHTAELQSRENLVCRL